LKLKSILLAILAVLVAGYVALTVVFWPDSDLQVSYDQADPSVLDLSFANGLSDAQKADFYHLSQGAEISPIRLLRALEDPATGRPFMENLERFGLLPDPARDDGLAVGLSLAKNKFTGELEMVGLTCAACHVGEIRYQGRGVRVDGAPNMFDMQLFYLGMVRAAEAAADDPDLRRRVVQRLFMQGYEEYGILTPLIRPLVLAGQAIGLLASFDEIEARVDLAKVLVAAIERRNEREDCSAPSAQCTSGYGRLDAFNGTRNFLLGRINLDNLVALDAPVKFPMVWGFREYAWFEWTLNTNTVMERNFTETLGAGATVLLEAKYASDGTRFSSSVPVRNMHRLETLAYRIEPPVWPAAILGDIDQGLVARGAELYATACAQCHDYDRGDYADGGLLRLRAFPPRATGTDASAARTVACPVPDVGDLPIRKRQYSAEDAALLAGSAGVPEPAAAFEGYGFAETVAVVVNTIKNKAYEEADVSEAEQREFEDTAQRGDVAWRDTLITTGRPYVARPLRGIWAAAPYLHNGSVPTLYDLLLPPERRPVRFPLGHREFDPKRVGYRTDIPDADAGFVVDKTTAGSHNGGHAFGTELPDDDRWALVEYLKTK